MKNLRISQLPRMGRGYMRDDNILLIYDIEEGTTKGITLGDVRDYAKRGPLGYGTRKQLKTLFEETPQKESLWMRIKRLFNWI